MPNWPETVRNHLTDDKALRGLARIGDVRIVSPGDFMTRVLEATKK